MADNTETSEMGNFSIQDTMSKGAGSQELLNDLLGSETTGADPDTITEITKDIKDEVTEDVITTSETEGKSPDNKEDKKENQDNENNKKDGEDGDQKDENDEGEKEQDKKEGDDKKDKGNPDEPKEEQQEQQKTEPGKLSPQQVKNLLEAMNNEEKKVQDKINAKKQKGKKIKSQKDW